MVKKPDGKRSKTINYATIVAVLGAIQVTLPVVKETIPEDAYGWILMVIAVGIAYYRTITTGPLK